MDQLLIEEAEEKAGLRQWLRLLTTSVLVDFRCVDEGHCSGVVK
jgi:hypothetical protein